MKYESLVRELIYEANIRGNARNFYFTLREPSDDENYIAVECNGSEVYKRSYAYNFSNVDRELVYKQVYFDITTFGLSSCLKAREEYSRTPYFNHKNI